MASLRRELAAVSAGLSACESALESARRAEAEALARAEALSARTARPGRAAVARPGGGNSADLAGELRALEALRANPALRGPRMGGKLAGLIGVSGATARRYRAKFLNPDGTLREAIGEPAASALQGAQAA